MTAAWTVLLAEGDEASKTGSIGPGLSAFVVVLLLVVATVFLMRSMLKHVGRVPPTFDPPPRGAADADATDEAQGGEDAADGEPDSR